MKDLRDIAQADPEKFKEKVNLWIEEGGTIKSLAEDLGIPYATLYRLCSDLGLKVGASVLGKVPLDDWAHKSKKQIAEERCLPYQHVYNYYQYHKQRLEEGIRAFKRSEGVGETVVGSAPPIAGGPEGLPKGREESVQEGPRPTLAGEQTRDDGD